MGASAYRLLHPPQRIFHRRSRSPTYTSHQLQAPDGAPFEAWCLPHQAPRGRLIVCHGYWADRFQVLGVADGLQTRGYEVWLVELRGHGARPGPYTFGLKEARDIGQLIIWAGQGATGRLPVGLLGWSMGGMVMCHVALASQEVRAVVLDSTYDTFFPVLARSMQRLYRVPVFPWVWLTWWGVSVGLGRALHQLDPIRIAPQLQQPLLAIQGEADRRVEAAWALRLFERWAGPKQRWLAPNVGHVGMFAHFPQEYCDRVARFFDQHLAGRVSC